MKITLKNVASCDENPVILETDQKINLAYGLNGTGKTTLSDYLYYKDQSKDKFNDCDLTDTGNAKILVYNQNFIKDNFYDKDSLKGIFTLSKENKEAEESIKQAEQNIKKFEEEKTKKEKDKEEYEKNQKINLEEIQKAIWSIKTDYTGGDRVLEFCLISLMGKKEKLFNHIKSIQKSENQPTSIEVLKKEARLIKEGEPQETLPKIKMNIKDIEENSIWKEVIVGKEDSPVANLITKLNNSDWVKQGVNYLSISEEQCPFCQEKTITETVAKNIKDYFDETYENKITEIESLYNQYKDKQILIPKISKYQNHPLIEQDKDRIEILYNKLVTTLNDNLSSIKQKSENSSQKIEIKETKDEITEINNFIEKINQDIAIYNEKLKNKDQTQKKIKNQFWQIMRWNYDNALIQHEKNKDKTEKKIEEINNEITGINKKISLQKENIKQQQENMINIEGAINNINNGLRELGIEGFNIIKFQENSYKIVREGQEEGQFQTLSEGEKMIISFLYFMELCKGKESKEEVVKNKIVVIDDPISSLSHTYIFNLSIWIKNHFFKSENYKQILVLTHSLYFFHELIRYDKNRKLFRFLKLSTNKIQIEKMEENEIKNEYESYWQVIKDHENGKASNGLLANSMRNILEHFFGFIYKEGLEKKLESLGKDNKFESFLRYMNRESHSDAINITDDKEIDSKLFKDAFKEVFTKSGYEEHYKNMMKT